MASLSTEEVQGLYNVAVVVIIYYGHKKDRVLIHVIQ